MPPGVLNVITCPRELAASVGTHICTSHKVMMTWRALVTHMPRHRLTPWPTGWQVRKVSFTGSTRVGKVLMRECASTVKKVRGKRLPTNTHIGGASFPLSPGREGGGLRP